MTAAREDKRDAAQRMTLRVISKDKSGSIQEIFEQPIPASADAICLFLRRWHCRSAVAAAMIAGGTITIERVK